MSEFSIPVLRVPVSFIRKTPPSVPVMYQGEHVATAWLRDGSYSFTMYHGELERGLTTGKLMIKPRFIDQVETGKLNVRRYFAIEMVSKLEADL